MEVGVVIVVWAQGPQTPKGKVRMAFFLFRYLAASLGLLVRKAEQQKIDMWRVGGNNHGDFHLLSIDARDSRPLCDCDRLLCHLVLVCSLGATGRNDGNAT